MVVKRQMSPKTAKKNLDGERAPISSEKRTLAALKAALILIRSPLAAAPTRTKSSQMQSMI